MVTGAGGDVCGAGGSGVADFAEPKKFPKTIVVSQSRIRKEKATIKICNTSEFFCGHEETHTRRKTTNYM